MNQPLRQPSLVVSVGEFAARLREVFRRVKPFEYIGITGEISQWNPRQNGVYFTIKDQNAVLECFSYLNRAAKFPKAALGTAVIAYGSVRVVERRSRYELLVEELALTGIGELHAQYEALKERFRGEGLFDAARKRKIARFPSQVILVSADGKGAEDFLKVMRERAPSVNVRFIETRVQGVGAEVEIATKLDEAAKLRPDVIVLARGGGSYEDLFPFNLEPVVRAIVRSSVPVITGIGHTGDHHLADDVADLSCETPTNAAQHIANLWQRGSERFERLAAQLDREMRDLFARALQRGDAAMDSLERALERSLAVKRERVVTLERRLNAQNPARHLSQRATRVAAVRERLPAAWQRYISQRGARLQTAAGKLALFDPEQPLARGYALIFKDGSLVRSARDVVSGDAITAQLGHGAIGARVETVSDE
jgi:exodeoxyribonuclease VII large subunit